MIISTENGKCLINLGNLTKDQVSLNCLMTSLSLIVIHKNNSLNNLLNLSMIIRITRDGKKLIVKLIILTHKNIFQIIYITMIMFHNSFAIKNMRILIQKVY